MRNQVKFNDNEAKVLLSLYNETLASTGGEFGYVEDADRCGMKKAEFAGYVGILAKKGVFEYIDELGEEGKYKKSVQFNIKEEFQTIAKALDEPVVEVAKKYNSGQIEAAKNALRKTTYQKLAKDLKAETGESFIGLSKEQIIEKLWHTALETAEEFIAKMDKKFPKAN